MKPQKTHCRIVVDSKEEMLVEGFRIEIGADMKKKWRSVNEKKAKKGQKKARKKVS